jgi:NAD(P)-dependent dehydrogenase (short-subunit alcohol dehydrogenase family)
MLTRPLGESVALVTGGASGIGAAVARRLALRGARVVLADLDVAAGEALAGELGGSFMAIDVRDLAASHRAVAHAEEAYGRLDVVHLNAGLATGGMRLDDLQLDTYRRLMAVNVDGVVFGLAAALPALRRAGGGAVVATSSLSGLTAFPGDALYAASKHAVVGLVRSVAESVAGDRITVNAICPGFTDTALVAPFADTFRAAGFPLLTADDVAGVVERIVEGDATGEAWVIQPGRLPAPYRFGGVPGASSGAGHQAPPESVRTGEAVR